MQCFILHLIHFCTILYLNTNPTYCLSFVSLFLLLITIYNFCVLWHVFYIIFFVCMTTAHLTLHNMVNVVQPQNLSFYKWNWWWFNCVLRDFGTVSRDSPVTCEEAQAGRTDFITEDVQLQSCLSLLLQLWLGSHVDLPCRRLVHNPPLLNVFTAVVRPLQVQQNALITLIWHRGIDEMYELQEASVFMEKSHSDSALPV